MNDFKRYGRSYRVTAQADAETRTTPQAVNPLYVRSADGAMVPFQGGAERLRERRRAAPRRRRDLAPAGSRGD